MYDIQRYGGDTFCESQYILSRCNITGPNQTLEIVRVSMKTRRYVRYREEKITTEYENLNGEGIPNILLNKAM